MSDTVPDYQADRLVLRFVPAAPTWPEGSSLTAGDRTAAGLTLTWTAAQDPTAAEQATKGGTHFTGAGTLGFTVEIEGLQSGF